MNSGKSLVEIKGSGSTLGLHIYDISFFAKVEKELRKLLKRSNSKQFFQGANIILKTAGNDVSSNEFSKLSTILEEEGNLHLIKTEESTESIEGVQSADSPTSSGIPGRPSTFRPPAIQKSTSLASETTAPQIAKENKTTKKSSVKNDPLTKSLLSAIPSEKSPTRKVKKKPKQNPAEPTAQPNLELFGLRDVDALDACLIRQTLHSGQKIYSKSSIVLLGDVNGGAEIVSDNNIIILGTLRGVAHAGLEGNYQAIVFALKMQPTQLRISDVFSRPSTKDHMDQSAESEVAFVEDRDIVIETCQKFRV